MFNLFNGNRAAMVLAGTVAASAAVLSLAAQSGGIVPTEFHKFTIDPGPVPDLTVFATGECIGKIEPCG